MSEANKPGYHPDADQINAFVEHALPAHEQQQMLAHLAVCPECRATVAMSLPPEEVPAASAVQATGAYWLAVWRFAIPATALAVITLSIVHVHRVSTSRQQVNPPVQTAAVHPPEPKVTSPPVIKSSPILDRKAKAVEPAGKTAQQHSLTITGPVVSRQQIEPSLADRKTGTLQSASRSVPAPLPPPNPHADEAAKSAAQQSGGAVSTGGAGRDKIEQQVTDANVVMGGPALKKAEEMPAQLSLPSGLPVLSIATHLRQILAIDAHNNLFLSDDGGTSWRAVPVRWKGRAVKANLVSYGAAPTANMIAGEVVQRAPAVNSGPAPASLASANVPSQNGDNSLSGTVTDQSGAVIPGAIVTVTAANGGFTHTEKSDASGRYRIDGLAAGSYAMKTQALGFQEQLTQGVNVNATQPNVANVVLSVGSATETVTVEADSMSIEVVRSPEAKDRRRPSAPPVFEIVTDNGEHWTSPDGMKWRHK